MKKELIKKNFNIEELQSEILVIANSFHSFCIANDIEYFICGGTLLGGIRHQGFIPWDDDFDVALPRKSFNKLLKLWNNNVQDFQLSKIGDKGYLKFGTPAKIHNNLYRLKEKGEHENGMPEYSSYGIFIDIFPLDEYPNNFFGQTMNFLVGKMILGKKLSYFKNTRKPLWMRICFLFLKLIPNSFLFLLKKYCAKFLNQEQKDNMFGYGIETPYHNLWINKKNLYPFSLGTFEKKFKFYFPSEPDTYLRQRYGDYMIIPKASDQGRHINEIYRYTALKRKR